MRWRDVQCDEELGEHVLQLLNDTSKQRRDRWSNGVRSERSAVEAVHDLALCGVG